LEGEVSLFAETRLRGINHSVFKIYHIMVSPATENLQFILRTDIPRYFQVRLFMRYLTKRI